MGHNTGTILAAAGLIKHLPFEILVTAFHRYVLGGPLLRVARSGQHGRLTRPQPRAVGTFLVRRHRVKDLSMQPRSSSTWRPMMSPQWRRFRFSLLREDFRRLDQAGNDQYINGVAQVHDTCEDTSNVIILGPLVF